MTSGPATRTFDTTRFTMRALMRSDTAALYGTLSDEAQCRYMSQPHFTSLEALADWLTDSEWPGRTWVATDKTDGTLAGRFVAFPGRDAGVLELGYITIAERQGHGVATECMTALVDHLFSEGIVAVSMWKLTRKTRLRCGSLNVSALPAKLTCVSTKSRTKACAIC
ncbi:GNAT family N-acetyltransferase [Gemmobacter sp. 24YEA27]|uniref:GNAT family N-acetyltransferase n=1 Tax=Gemmobacter sp. 24YEA27 TaxID=3040672 RepID=UPI0024B393CA|nr:GNAT family N-acetyltransferase [Gemmobacter sp. 24YEA27]